MIDFETRGHVAVITINRPEARNAVNGEVAEGIEAAIDRLEEDADLWVGVLTGAGTVFCAGADLKIIGTNAGVMSTKRGGFGGFVRRDREKPVIAAVDGPALAGGCELVLASDLVVASKAARFGIPEVKRSLIAAAGGVFRLPRTVPQKIAMEMALTGDPISAERAYELGLVNEVTEAGTALDAALALAERICVNAPLAVRESRRVVLAAHGRDEDELWTVTNAGMAAVVASEDFREGPLAFIEKRAPVWKGR